MITAKERADAYVSGIEYMARGPIMQTAEIVKAYIAGYTQGKCTDSVPARYKNAIKTAIDDLLDYFNGENEVDNEFLQRFTLEMLKDAIDYE
jgi:hypothetical protein